MSKKVGSILCLLMISTNINVQADSFFPFTLQDDSSVKSLFVGASIYAIGEVVYRRYCKLRKETYLKNKGTLETIEAIVTRLISALGLVNSNALHDELTKLQEKLESHMREHYQSLDEEDIKTLVTAAFQKHMEANFGMYENVIKGIAHDVVDDMIESLEKRVEFLEKRKNESDSQQDQTAK